GLALCGVRRRRARDSDEDPRDEHAGVRRRLPSGRGTQALAERRRLRARFVSHLLDGVRFIRDGRLFLLRAGRRLVAELFLLILGLRASRPPLRLNEDIEVHELVLRPDGEVEVSKYLLARRRVGESKSELLDAGRIVQS